MSNQNSSESNPISCLIVLAAWALAFVSVYFIWPLFPVESGPMLLLKIAGAAAVWYILVKFYALAVSLALLAISLVMIGIAKILERTK